MRRSMLSLVVAVTFSLGVALAAQAQDPAGTGAAAADQVAAPAASAGCFVYPKSHSKGEVHTTYAMYSKDCSSPAVMARPTAISMAGPTLFTGGANPAITTTQNPETPASLGCLYLKNPNYAGCSPYTSTGSFVIGGPSVINTKTAIVVVDAFNNPDADFDLATFDAQWGLPTQSCPLGSGFGGMTCGTQSHLGIIYANSANGGAASCSGVPANDAGWSVEISLDIEAAHAMHPGAPVVLVEACTNSFADLNYAESVAIDYLVNAKVNNACCYGPNYKTFGGTISNSWGATDGFNSGQQLGWDTIYRDSYPYAGWATKTHAQVFASSGDTGHVAIWPSTDPWVVSVGGTGILRNANGTPNPPFFTENCWAGSGGGPSSVETYSDTFVNAGSNMGPWANYQASFQGYNAGGSARMTPDVAADADPNSGLWTYSLFGLGGWSPIGGTSLASPLTAAIVARGNQHLSTWGGFYGGGGFFTAREHALVYGELDMNTFFKANWFDVTTGSNGVSAIAGYDQCTGIGSPRGIAGK